MMLAKRRVYFIKSKAFALALLFCILPPFESRAASLRWLDNNRFELSDYGMILERPGAAWRVVETQHPMIVEMVYQRGKGKIVIDIRELPPTRADYAKKGRRYQAGELKVSALARELMAGYESGGLQFFEVRELEDNIYTAATDAERRLYFFHFHMVKRRDHRVPVVIEMGIPRELYHEFHPRFLSLVRELTDWSKQPDGNAKPLP